MRTSRRIAIRGAALAVLMAVGVATGPTLLRAADAFVSDKKAYEQGLAAYRGGNYDIALHALGFTAQKGHFWSKFFLARIYADPSSAHTDHGKAYELYLEIVEKHADMDTKDWRAGGFGQALLAFARYVKNGVKSIGVRPNPDEAVFYLQEAANTYGIEDAQFELAKLYIDENSPHKDLDKGHDLLWSLHLKSHAGAQAELARAYWRGNEKVPQDKAQAWAFIELAAANASDRDRIWIEEIRQNIFCGTTSGTRKNSDGYVAEWERLFGRVVPRRRDRSALGARLVRVCSNGEPVPPIKRLRTAN